MTAWLTSLGINLDLIPYLTALLVAYALALPIGWNRERNERSAGSRTFPLVAIATCGFVQAAERITLGEAEATARIMKEPGLVFTSTWYLGFSRPVILILPQEALATIRG